jgi:CIC family chloride channel protein
VKQAQDIMETGFIVAGAKNAMLPEDIDNGRPIIVEREARIVGLIPPQLRAMAGSHPDVRVEKFVESRLVICREQDLLSMAFARLPRRCGDSILRGVPPPHHRCG